MVYKNNVVAAVKVAGKILREDGESVTLPFGSEYSLLIKNLSSVRMQVKVSIDGTDATEGTWLIIDANSSLELERFIKNGNLKAGNKFKFIERTKDIEDNRGIKIEDGLIRIESKKEYIVPPYVPPAYTYGSAGYWLGGYYYPYQQPWITYTTQGGNTVFNTQTNCGAQPCGVRAMNMCASSAPAPSENGITVPGSESNQQFHQVSSFATEATSDVLVLRLRGELAGNKVSQPVTVKTKLKCITCGKSNKSFHKFCVKCGRL